MYTTIRRFEQGAGNLMKIERFLAATAVVLTLILPVASLAQADSPPSGTSIERAELLRKAHPEIVDGYFYDQAGLIVLNLTVANASRIVDLEGSRPG